MVCGLRRIRIEDAEGFPIVYIWVREVGVDNKGEHLHILAHVPKHLFRKFKRLANVWLPGNEIQITAASYRISKAEDGKLHSILHYMAEQMDHRANFRTAWRRVKEGTIFGARCGCSQSLKAEKAKTLKAREMWRRHRKKPDCLHAQGIQKKGSAVALPLSGADWLLVNHQTAISDD